MSYHTDSPRTLECTCSQQRLGPWLLLLAALAGLAMAPPSRAEFNVAFSSAIETQPSIASNSQTGEFMVAYLKDAYQGFSLETELRARLFNSDGTPRGDVIAPFGTGTHRAIGRPAIAYSPNSNIYYVAVAVSTSSGDRVLGRPLDADGNSLPVPNHLFDDGPYDLYGLDEMGHNEVRIAHNSILDEFIVTMPRTRPDGTHEVVAQRVRDGFHEGPVVQLHYSGLGGFDSNAIAHAPIPTVPVGGRYLFAIGSSHSIRLSLRDAHANVIPTASNIPFDYGTPDTGSGQPDIAFGTVDGLERFLVVFSDKDNCEWNVDSCPVVAEQWSGVWGGYVDPYRTVYSGFPANTPFPISKIWSHLAAVKPFWPRVTYSPDAQAFLVVWKELPWMDARNGETRTHIRGSVVDYFWDDPTTAPPETDDVVISDVTGECPPSVPPPYSGTCPSEEDPVLPDVAALSGTSAVVVWQQQFPPNPDDLDIIGDLDFEVSCTAFTEVCDGSDNDCDGLVDEGFDGDGDGYTTCEGDCRDSDPAIHPEAQEICGDRQDNDCDGLIDENYDADRDRYSTCQGDCDDADPRTNPGAQEVCGDRRDNDCDGSVDEGFDADRDRYADCEGDCNDRDPRINPAAEEICDRVDNDCDGLIDESDDSDQDGYEACGGDCNDSDPLIHPGAPEVCGDGLDNNCNGQIDESADDDQDGITTCGGDCDDSNPTVRPGMPEVCGDNLDNDCNPATPDLFDSDGDGYACNVDCHDWRPNVHPGAPEIPCDGYDNDCNGATPDDFDADADGFTCSVDCDDAVATCTDDCTDSDNDGVADCAGDPPLPVLPGELAVDFGDDGLWHYASWDWKMLTPWDPEDVVAWQDKLAADFGAGRGLYANDHDGGSSNWTRLTSWDPYKILAWGPRLAVAFDAGRGLYVYDTSGWTKLTPWEPVQMVAWGDKLAVAFGTGRGVWIYDSSGWNRITSWSPYDMIAWGDRLVAAFDSERGTYVYGDSGWTRLTFWEPVQMVAWGDKLAASFGSGRGLWIRESDSWRRITSWDPNDIVVWGDSLAVAFDVGRGLYRYDGSGWKNITAAEPIEMTAIADWLALTFGFETILIDESGWNWYVIEYKPGHMVPVDLL